MFRTFPLSIIRSFSLYTQQWYMSYRYCWQLARKLSAISVWHIPLLCVQWKTPDDGQRKCPKHVEFYSKNKFEKLVHLVGFIIRICASTFAFYILTKDLPMKLHTYALYDLVGTMMHNSAKKYVCHYFCYANTWNINHTRPMIYDTRS